MTQPTARESEVAELLDGGATYRQAAAILGISVDTIDRHRQRQRMRLKGGADGPLSQREIDIVRLIADGKTYREAAVILSLSVKTVDCYAQRIKLKTQCFSIALLVRWAIKQGLVIA